MLEAEDLPNRHSTGRNASYYLPIYDTACFSALAQASLPFFQTPPDDFGDSPLLMRRGAVIAALEAGVGELAAEIADARAVGIEAEMLVPADVPGLVPIVKTDWFAAAALYPGAGPIDVHALSMGFLRGARRQGIEIRYNERVCAIETARGRISEVRTGSGRYSCRIVINAGGIGRLAGARPIDFQPRRRHIVSIPLGSDAPSRDWAFFRCPSLPFYMKPEGNQLLASLMDADPDEPGDCMSNYLRVAEAADAVNRYTNLNVRSISRAWAGHRTFSLDEAPVVGRDPLVDGFIWAAGLGGAGVMTSPIIGELAAKAVAGSEMTALHKTTDPSRISL